jgi:hypothetical protein
MARGYTGDSKSDKAYDRMNKAMERSERGNRNTEKKASGNPIVEQLKALYPDTWQEELAQLQRDWAAKMAAGDTGARIKSAEEYRKQMEKAEK